MIDKITWAVTNDVNDLGTTVLIRVNFFENETASDPDTSKIKIKNPYGLTAQTLTSMTRVTAGVYEYDYQTSTSDAQGKYNAAVSFTSSSQDFVENDIYFYVE